jgi:hypothetical protein
MQVRLIAPMLAALWIVPAAAQSLSEARQFLRHICAPKNISGAKCKVARMYPGHPAGSCDVDVSNSQPVAGRFLAAGSVLVIVGYGSGCEPHASNWGGSLLFERTAGGYAFKDYLPGLVTDQCIVAAAGGGQADRLICRSGSMHQGYAGSFVSEVVLSSNKGKVSFDLKPLFAAESSEGAYETETVDCRKSDQEQFFGLSDLRLAPGGQALTVRAILATPAMVQAACAVPRARWSGDARELVPEGLAPFTAKPAETTLTLDLATSR